MLMLTSLVKPVIRAINAACVVLLAGVYVYTYYDYLHTMTEQGGLDITTASTEYRHAQLGVITVQK